MGKWSCENNVVLGDFLRIGIHTYSIMDVPRCFSEIEIAHNSDIDALTARADAAEQRADDLKRRLSNIVTILDPGNEPSAPFPNASDWEHQSYSRVRIAWDTKRIAYERAKTIAEGWNHE